MDNLMIIRFVLCEMFGVEEIDIVMMKSRKQNNVEARRLYVYYLWMFKKVKHAHMKRYVKGLHHSTSIYQCTVFENDMKVSPLYKKRLITLLYYADREEWSSLKERMYYPKEVLYDVHYKKVYQDIINYLK
tara:strand:+ start:3513 stop:3905 length:393 start_codon:yes stop_codon:yes gene_type:complete